MNQDPRSRDVGRSLAPWASAAAVLTVGVAAIVYGLWPASDSALSRDGGDGAAPVHAEHRSLPPVDVETGVVHVHGLGVDPGDGALYAATHSGLFRIPETGSAVRVANRAQDTMGFSVVGPGHFIGSGHPDFREDDVRPPLLGLIESTDAGRTWKRISLHGKADFHSLGSAHGMVYGYDSTSGTFMVTEDRREWERRSSRPLYDVVMSPSDAERVVATAPEGTLLSTDGGRSWKEAPGAPALVRLSWPANGPLAGVDSMGGVHVSSDGGSTWQRRGSVGGEPEAIVAVPGQGPAAVPSLYVAVRDLGILLSSDGGRTFAVRYSESGS
jgi:hypothetical protein